MDVNKLKGIDILKRLFFLLLGIMFYATAANMFFLKNNIAAGGFVGIATVVNALLPINVGLFVIIMNIPFLIWAVFAKGWRYTLIVGLAAVLYSFVLNVFSGLPVATDDMMLASISGGVLYAIGAVFLLRADVSVGGTDLVARLLVRVCKSLSLGKAFMLIDGCIVLFSMLVFGKIEAGLYAALAIYICSVFTDKIITGLNIASICYVITASSVEEMSEEIMTRMNRGVTNQKATGMHSHSEKNVLTVVVRPREIYRLKDIVARYDPFAFVVIAWAKEVQGGGFQGKHGHYDKLKV